MTAGQIYFSFVLPVLIGATATAFVFGSEFIQRRRAARQQHPAD